MTNSSQALAQVLSNLADGSIKVVDLTHPLGENTPVIALPPEFAQSPPFSREVISKYNETGPAWYWNTIHVGEHTGTHFDAPAHWISGKDLPNNTLDTIPAGKHVGPVCVIDASKESAADADFLLTPEFIENWEKTHGRIPAGAWVLMRTDWSKRIAEPSFLNIKEDGPHSPGPSVACVEFLIERNVAGFGTETVGTDAGQGFLFDTPLPCHTLIHGAGKFGLASLCNLDQLPPTGAMLITAPMKIVDGSGSPVRVFAITPA
ncbi:MAG: cyclase family protein [Desulfuromonadales bacterium]|nr:cyclase family protein [Desulfuromonadales bacterium]